MSIGATCEIVNGGTPKTGKSEYWNGEHQWITPAEMGKRATPYVEETERSLTDLGLANCSARLLPPSSVILSSRAPIGHLAINTRPMAFNQGCKGLIPGKLLSHKFLYHYLGSIVELLNDLGTGATFKELSGAKLKEVLVPLPPLDEQQRIVGILDEAFEGIATAKAKAEQNLQNARAIFESQLDTVFAERGKSWTERRLGDVSRLNYGYTESASQIAVGPKFLRITDIQQNRVDWTTVPYCPIEDGEYEKFRLTDGDIVFARTGATTGKSFLVTQPPEAVFASYLIRLRISTDSLLPQFVYLFFQTKHYWDKIRLGVSGSAQGGFNATKLGELPMPFPVSRQEQGFIVDRFASLAESTDRLLSVYQRKLEELDDLKRSLLHHAFSGQL